MTRAQPGILADLPSQARYLSFQLISTPPPDQLRAQLEQLIIDDNLVVGLGSSLINTLGLSRVSLPPFPSYPTSPVDIPATPAALWCWLRGDDRGELIHTTLRLQQHFASTLALEQCVDSFRFQAGRDLTGYEDGTENPAGDDALAAAVVGSGPLQHSSFVAVQRWQHQMARFDALTPAQQDHSIGRRRSDNEELDDAPESAHVKRTAQESFTPEAFVLRRSMPWNDANNQGLVFVAFGHSLQAFEQQLQRMCGVDDGIVDALFQFTQPKTGAYFWCPPVQGGQLALDAAARN